MAAKHFMHEAFSNAHGQLHRELGVPLDKPIPVEKLRAAVKAGDLLCGLFP